MVTTIDIYIHDITKTKLGFSRYLGHRYVSTETEVIDEGFMMRMMLIHMHAFIDIHLELQPERYDENTEPVSGKTQIPIMRFFSLRFSILLAFFFQPTFSYDDPLHRLYKEWIDIEGRGGKRKRS